MRGLSGSRREAITEHHFDAVFGPRASQEELFDEVARDVVYDVLEGYNGTIMAYGQTGSGKTHTIGNNLGTSGIIPRVATELMAVAESDAAMETTLFMSYVQVYCEKIQDILRNDTPMLQLREDSHGQVFLENVQEVVVTNLGECMKLLQVGERNRAFAYTRMNASSSRRCEREGEKRREEKRREEKRREEKRREEKRREE